jgi:hypothetical protein
VAAGFDLGSNSPASLLADEIKAGTVEKEGEKRAQVVFAA